MSGFSWDPSIPRDSFGKISFPECTSLLRTNRLFPERPAFPQGFQQTHRGNFTPNTEWEPGRNTRLEAASLAEVPGARRVPPDGSWLMATSPAVAASVRRA